MNPRETQGGAGGPPMNPMALMNMLKSENGMQELMLEPLFPTEDGGEVSQAAVLADVVNIYRMDAKKFGQLHGVDISIQQMTEERMAWMLGEMINGDPSPLIDCMNDIEDKHHRVFEEAMDDDEFEAYKEMKESVLYTHNAGNDEE